MIVKLLSGRSKQTCFLGEEYQISCHDFTIVLWPTKAAWQEPIYGWQTGTGSGTGTVHKCYLKKTQYINLSYKLFGNETIKKLKLLFANYCVYLQIVVKIFEC